MKLLKVTFLTPLFFVGLIQSKQESDRTGKLLSLFNVVTFPNDACQGDGGGKNGTCYTKEECSTKGGEEIGSCASGFGVCCLITLECGDSTSENTTYFVSDNSPAAGSCNTRICKADQNICQLRLDFTKFAITGPSTSTATIGKEINGVISTDGVEKIVSATQCNKDTFSISSPGNPSPPVICGMMTKEHIYVDASDECVSLNFNLLGASSTREWEILVTQFKCDYNNLAPSGCTQYFFGPQNEGIVKSFNFDGDVHLANQNQKICVRKEKATSRICWSREEKKDFLISGGKDPETSKGFVGKESKCCGYGKDGKNEFGFDCIIIPSASKQTPTSPDVTDFIEGGEFCGANLVSVDQQIDSKVICSMRQPFMIEFHTDNFEQEKDTGKEENGSKGFKLKYKLS